MMRKVIVFCLVFPAAAVPLRAQSYTYNYSDFQWSPQVAEDNKAATWEDTSAFVVNSLNDSDHTSLVLPEDLPYRAFADLTYSASSPSRCQLSVSKALDDSAARYTTREVLLIDLSKIDPLSITVKGVDHRKAPIGFVISLQGTNSTQAVTGMRFTYDKEKKGRLAKYGWWYPMWNNPEEIKAFTCTNGDKKCSQVPISESNVLLSVKDQEMSKRIARALMHAALLCGGTKSVSPF